MEWISQYAGWFLVPFAFLAVLLGGGWLSDNTSYPWKHWSRDQNLGAFIICFGPGLFLTGIVMGWRLSQQPFVFERAWTALSFFVIGLGLSILGGKKFGTEDSPDEKSPKNIDSWNSRRKSLIDSNG